MAVKKPIKKTKPVASKVVAKKPTKKATPTKAPAKKIAKPVVARKQASIAVAKPVVKLKRSVASVTVIEPMVKLKTPKPVEKPVEQEFVPDALVIRNSKKGGIAYGGFEWPLTLGALVTCPDWEATTECGNGLHGYLDGLGNFGDLKRDADAVWWIVGVKREECIDLGGKVKFPRGRVEYFGTMAGAMKIIAQERRRVTASSESKTSQATTGDSAHSSTTGYYAHSSTTGNYAHSSTTGDSAHSSTTGDSAHSSTTGDYAIASALGIQNKAKAGPTGAIVLVNRKPYSNEIVAIRASKVGENGIKANTFYSLNEAGEFVEEKE